jgi:hypothetical protein
LGLSLAVIYFSIRMLLIDPLVLDGKPGIMPVIAQSFSGTRLHLAKLSGVCVLYAVVGLIVTTAVTAIAGTILLLSAKALGVPGLGKLLTALVAGAVGAAISVVGSVFVALFYRRLMRETINQR